MCANGAKNERHEQRFLMTYRMEKKRENLCLFSFSEDFESVSFGYILESVFYEFCVCFDVVGCFGCPFIIV